MIEPYIKAQDGDPIRSSDWNDTQIMAREALQNHDHSGEGDNAKPIGTSGIQDGAITAAKLADGAVTKEKLAAGAIEVTSIQDNSITSDKITSLDATKVTGQITTDQIADSAVTGVKIAANAIDATHVKDNGISNDKIESLDAAKLTGAIQVDSTNNVIQLSQGLQFSNTTVADDAPVGSIRWTGTAFEAKIDETTWTPFAGA